MANRKLRVGFISNCPTAGKTGLSRNMRALLPILYKTNKYELFFLAQGMSDGDGNFQKLPFKCEGVFKNFDQNRMNQDGNYQRVVAYGNTAVESFATNNKLDSIVLLDDFWAGLPEFYFNTDWYKHMKQNFMFVATADSEPILPLGKEWAEKCPNMKFWSEFASRALKEENYEKYKHCGTIHGSIDIKDFKPLPKQERLSLRRKFNISDDEKIIIYLGRNQLRKIFGSNLEGLAKFRKLYPNKKLRLLFHCAFNEPNGWPLNQIREQLGLKKEDLLCTYYCRNCTDWNVQPFEGEDLDCPICKVQRSRITAGVGSTINEEDLNKIYNLCDGSSSIFTSGGQEYTNIESLLSGLPLACPNYSCGEDFCKNDFVYTIKGTHTYESNTGFKKFVPDINSVVDFFKFVHDLSESKHKDITEKGRKWAIQQFDAYNIAKIYEEFFDSCKPIDWDIYLNKKKELKNINAQVEDKQNDEDFIRECYTKILNNSEVEKNDINGFNHWKTFLSQQKDKNQLKNEMVQVFRNAAVQHNQKVEPTSFESLLLNNGKKQFLIVCPESAGDCLYTSATLKSFRESYPREQWNLYLATKPEYFELFDCCEYIDKILPFQEFMNSEIACVGTGTNKKIFDGYCFITAGSQRFLNYLGNHKINLNLNY
jgi:glycosyltransferase involved in cell wall biosynthesis